MAEPLSYIHRFEKGAVPDAAAPWHLDPLAVEINLIPHDAARQAASEGRRDQSGARKASDRNRT